MVLCSYTYTQHARRQSLISILICLSLCWFLHGFLLVSATNIPWMRRPSTMRAKGLLRRGRHYHTVCLHQCTISIIGPVIETNHSLSMAEAQATHIQISFRLSRKLKHGELTCDPFLIFCQQFGEPWGGVFYISMGNANNLPEMYYITSQRMTKLATAQSDENKPNRTLQFHGDTAWCNEVTVILWLPSCPSSSMPFQT